MKNKIILRMTGFIVIVMFLFSLVSCKKEKLQKIRVAEVAHSVFYAAQYVAIEEGYFEEEGLKIELVNANGADKVTAALLSGDVQIGLQGPEPTIYLYNNNHNNYLINFAQVTRTDGSFIFGREKIEDFDVSMLAGKSILGGRVGGVPEMTLEYVLKNAGLTVVRDAEGSVSELRKEVNVRTDISFGAMAGSFIAGEGDFTTLFEPTATELVLGNKGYLLASVGELAGEVSYTAYSTSLKYFENNKDVLEKFTRAIYRGQMFIFNHTDKEVAEIMKKQFPDIDIVNLTEVVKRYREVNAWMKTPVFSEAGYNKLQDIMLAASQLDKTVKFETIVDVDIAKKVVNSFKNEK